MSYFTPYVDGSGLHLPTYNDVLEDMISSAKSIYGQDIYLGNDSADYQLLSILALKVADTYQAVQYAYNSRSPSTAIGAALDSVVKLNGLARKEAGYSTCQVELTGSPFSEIKNGSVKDASGNVWNLPSSVVIGSEGTILTTATCSIPGAVTALPGEIKKINTPTYGWKSVVNNVSAAVGNHIETDAELRRRQALSVSNPSQTMLDGTRGALQALDNVTRVAVYENDTNISEADETNNPYGLPPHSVTCVVEGGDDEAVAETILYHKGIGCYTNGTTLITVTDQNQYPNKVRFYRPNYVPIYIHVDLVRYTGYISSLTADTKTAIYEYIKDFDIGRKVSISMLTAVIVALNPNPTKPLFGVSNLTIGRSKDAMSASDLAIDYNEVASPDYDIIEVKLA